MSAPTFAAGTALGESYIIDHAIGAGGMAQVFAARDLRHDRLVAVKIVRDDVASPLLDERFDQEVRIAARLQHPHIVPLYDSGTAHGVRYFVMPLLAGTSLRHRVAAEPRPTLDEVVRIAEQVAGALDYAHASGIVHRDVKPENILVTGEHVLVADFGIARHTQGPSHLTEVGTAVGTPTYMSPEQASGEPVDGRADQYALGCVLYELITGRPPFVGTSGQAVMAMHFVTPVPPLGDAGSPAVHAVLSRAMAKTPSARFASVAEFARSLRVAVSEGAAIGPMDTPSVWGTSSRGNIPAAPGALLGRAELIETAITLLQRAETRLVTLTGPGGTGKTRVSLELGARLCDAFEGGAWFVSLASVAEAGAVLATVVRSLGISNTGDATPAEAIALRLGDRRALLILDDFERHVSVAGTLAELLSHASGLKMLVTSRIVLRLTVERELRVPPLAQDSGVQLFVMRAQAVSPSFSLDGVEEDVAAICERLDGLPLAIELAAARVRMLSPAAIRARMEHSLSLLTGGARDMPERHQTLRRAIDWSYQLLSADDRVLFAKLAVFAEGCTLEAAESVCGGGTEVLDGLTNLLDANLLARDAGGRGREPRFRMLGTIHEFAAELFDGLTSMAEVRQRHRDWYAELVRRATPHLAGAKQDEWMHAIGADDANVRSALEGCISEGDAERAVSMAAGLWRYWLVRSDLRAALDVLRRALALPATADPQTRALALSGAGMIAQNAGDLNSAATFFDDALALRRALHDEPGIARALADLGWLAWGRCDYGAARARTSESLALAERLGDLAVQARSYSNLGFTELSEGDDDAARAAFMKGLEMRRKLGDHRGAAFMQAGLAWVESRAGNIDSAFTLAEESMTGLHALGDRRLYAFALDVFAESLLRAREFERARNAVDPEALLIVRQVGDRWGLGHALSVLARAELGLGNIPRAEQFALESLSVRRAIADRWGAAESLFTLGDSARARGDEAAARPLFAESLAIRRALGDRKGILECERALISAGSSVR